MQLLDYAFYSEVLWLGLALKLGFQPLTKAVLVVISTTSQKKPPGLWQLKKITETICNVPVGLCFLYVLETM
jgi:hypothetical protein